MTGSQSSDISPLFAFISQWEYECCGEPLVVGQQTHLAVSVLDPESKIGWRNAAPGPILLGCGHHLPPEEHWLVDACVLQLWEVRQRYRLQAPRTLYPVPDSGDAVEITWMQPWERDWQPDLHGGDAAGWIVQFAVSQVVSSPPGVPLAEALGRAAVWDRLAAGRRH